MKKLLVCLLPVLALPLLTGCLWTSVPVESGGISSTEIVTFTEAPDHIHTPSGGNNLVEHDPVGYCGNTVTTVTRTPMGKGAGEEETVSFWGSDSVGLTDLLRWLDYSDGICRCLPEYAVETEFGDGVYGVNLTEGYVRRNDRQVSLTEEQQSLIRDIFQRQFSTGGNL